MKTTNPVDILTIARQLFNDEISGLNSIRDALNADFTQAVQMLLACEGKVIV